MARRVVIKTFGLVEDEMILPDERFGRPEPCARDPHLHVFAGGARGDNALDMRFKRHHISISRLPFGAGFYRSIRAASGPERHGARTS